MQRTLSSPQFALSSEAKSPVASSSRVRVYTYYIYVFIGAGGEKARQIEGERKERKEERKLRFGIVLLPASPRVYIARVAELLYFVCLGSFRGAAATICVEPSGPPWAPLSRSFLRPTPALHLALDPARFRSGRPRAVSDLT